ncbi:MAG: FG-GAP repeat protein [Parasphingorhabdus sp.]
MVPCVPAFASEPIEQHKILADDGAPEDFFGFNVAISGNTAIVGSYKADDEVKGVNTGSAYIFALSDGIWRQQAKLTAGDGLANDTLGGNVTISGDTAAAGAIGHDKNGDNSGAAYVFARSGATWGQQAKLTASDGAKGDAFGQSIAVHGNTMVIGAPHDDDKGDGSGSVYIFTRAGTIWTEQVKLTAADGAAGDLFGISVAVYRDTVLIGADLNDEKAPNAGAAYVFVRSGDGWVQQAKLTADDGADTDIFGVRVALYGDTALISARRDDDEIMGVDAGSAYIFTRTGMAWNQQAKLTAPDGAADDRFGRSVALNGKMALIGAMHHDDRGNDSGAAYIFKRSGHMWKQHRKLTAADGKNGDLLGWSAALSEDIALVAASRSDDRGAESGSAYLFDLGDE